MNVYKVRADTAYGRLTFTRSERKYSNEDMQISAWDKECSDWRRLCETTGWVPPCLESPRGRAKTLPLDCISAALEPAGDMLLNAHAREMLAPLLLPCGEYLPVQVAGLDYRLFRCTTVADIADQERIEGERWKNDDGLSDRWKEIDRWSFHPERVATAPAVFTVPQRQSTLMCTDVLRQAVEAHDLLGFRFDLLWSPEGGGVEIDNSIAQFFGESGRQITIASRERRKAMQARLKARPVGTAPTSS